MGALTTRLALAVAAAAAAPALAQPYAIAWSTIDGGGSTLPSTGAGFGVAGTSGQPDAGQMAGGGYILVGGFWGIAFRDPCYPNCDGSTTPPILNVSDFICFLNRYAAGDEYANCDGSTVQPFLNVSDFICFQTRYAAGCP
jgi:hypothetical protein